MNDIRSLTNKIIGDKTLLALLSLLILFSVSLVFYHKYAGLLLMFSLFVFGFISLFTKSKRNKLISLVILVFLSLFHIVFTGLFYPSGVGEGEHPIVAVFFNGINFGLDFSGGTRIPIILEKPVDKTTMGELIKGIRKRVDVLGLSNPIVRAVGDSEIDVEIPFTDEERISFIEDVLSHQGIYQGIVDGRVAITGDDILPGTIRRIPSAYLRGADWGVSFSVENKGAERFAKVVKGKGNYPLYMFLDRPGNSIVIIPYDFLETSVPGVSINEMKKAIEDALKINNTDEAIDFYIYEELNLSSLSPRNNKTKAIIPRYLEEELKDKLISLGFEVVVKNDEELKPEFVKIKTGRLIVDSWEGVGLLSAPILSPDIAEGIPSYGYTITGTGKGVGQERIKNIEESAKRIESILKGGSLPVKISLGSRIVLPSTYGKQFLYYSVIGLVVALFIISIIAGIRYRHIKFTLPIVLISLSELIILLAILGCFSVDLAAMAGILAAIGVGVDAQIVITDEILKKYPAPVEEKVNAAFQIIKTNVIVAIVGMLPLMFSDLYNVTGFAISTILGALLGYLLSRPAYASILEYLVEHE